MVRVDIINLDVLHNLAADIDFVHVLVDIIELIDYLNFISGEIHHDFNETQCVETRNAWDQWRQRLNLH